MSLYDFHSRLQSSVDGLFSTVLQLPVRMPPVTESNGPVCRGVQDAASILAGLPPDELLQHADALRSIEEGRYAWAANLTSRTTWCARFEEVCSQVTTLLRGGCDIPSHWTTLPSLANATLRAVHTPSVHPVWEDHAKANASAQRKVLTLRLNMSIELSGVAQCNAGRGAARGLRARAARTRAP